MKFPALAMAVLACASILLNGCGQSNSAQDLSTTGLKATPQLSREQVQAAWEKKHPGETAPQ